MAVPDGSFVPARSKAEAVARMYALAGAPPEPLGPGSTEKKSVLVAVASRLALPATLTSTKPELGRQIAQSLGATWGQQSWSRGSTITLRGLNTILEAATYEVARRSRLTPVEEAFDLGGPFPGFAPARSKLEAVNRISALTGSGPQTLGPGSKERKSVLSDLAVGLGLPVRVAANKPDLGRDIAESLGTGWDPGCWSTGQTITLRGLNVLLAAAERRLGLLGSDLSATFSSPRAEAAAILAVLSDAITPHWDGTRCVTEMRDAEFAHWKQTEWAGWYFEYVGLPALVNSFGGGPRRVLQTTFDYALRSTWDLKAHSLGKGRTAILNDAEAARTCLRAEPHAGLGFVILSGSPDYSTAADFDTWHRQERGAPPASVGSRALKAGFAPVRLEAFHLPDAEALDDQLASGSMSVMQQGRQQSGAARKPKLRIHLAAASAAGGIRVAERSLSE